MFYIAAFVILYVYSIISISDKPETQKKMFLFACVLLAFFAGIRNPDKWADTLVYKVDFEDFTKPIFDFSLNDPINGYSEMGFHFLGYIVKTFTGNFIVYLLFISVLTFFLLYKSLDKYCIFPLLGLCDYVARFLFNRNFIQIRSGLAIAVIIFGLQYAYKRQWLKYFIVVGIAYLFHHSSLLAIPFYFFNLIKFKKSHIVIGLCLAAILAATVAPSISTYVDNWSEDLQYTTYVQGIYKEAALGLRNPMIYFQMFVLLLFTFNERRLKKISPYYYVLRNGYFYSTLILVFFCDYTALSGRTSTIFATFEMFIIPMFVMLFSKKNRFLSYVGIGLVLTAIFILKYSDTTKGF
jgi:hypothetical protein